ncbi:MAG: DUF3667 domain-containing protein [Bacteroidota bacterium]
MTKCLNCYKTISEEASYCPSCGAGVVTERITLNKIISDVAETIFGWDNKYFFTLRSLILRPHLVLEDYVSGVRKRYVPPFTFLVIGATLMLFTFTFFLDGFMEDLKAFNIQLVERYKGFGVKDLDLERVDQVQAQILKYFNLVTLLLMPLYALFTYIIYHKTYNYAEHLVFNAYVQGTGLVISLIVFYLSLITHPVVFAIITLTTWSLHAYIFGKLYRLGAGVSILKLFFFQVMLFISITLILALTVLVVILKAYL